MLLRDVPQFILADIPTKVFFIHRQGYAFHSGAARISRIIGPQPLVVQDKLKA
jgi:hypothetical protein